MKLEETIHARDKSTPASTPGKTVADSISEKSHSDYTCYTMRSDNQDIVAVLIETKSKHPKFKQALALEIPVAILPSPTRGEGA